MGTFKKALHSKIDVFVKFESAINLEISGQFKKKNLYSFYLGYKDHMLLLLLSTHSSLIIGGSPLLLSDGGSPPASPASLLAGLLRRRDPSTNPGPIAWWVSVGN